ncbi:MAG: hypothetical protein ACYTGG_12840, partial [Planctomycetota bacterium]|jgi:YHS domain-containing protein
MGDPIVKTYDGREVRFCCKACVPAFEADMKAGFAKIDEAIVKQQKKSYPLETCLVMDNEPLEGEDGTPFDYVHNNRLVRFCCKRCARKFRDDPATYLAKLDAAIIEQQLPDYPLETCVVSGQKLGSMGEPKNIVMANRLVRLCCGGCEKSLRADPLVYLGKLGPADGGPATTRAASAETRTVVLKGLTTGLPAAWEEYPVTSNMRAMNLRVNGDAAELIIYYFGPNGAGPVDANIDRWAGQFQAPDGRPAQAKRSETTVAGMPAYLAEMRGSYRGMSQVATAGQAALCAIVEGPEGPLYFKFVGDEGVVEDHRDAFMTMIKGLKKEGGPS